MNIFLIHSSKDAEECEKLRDILTINGNHVTTTINMNIGENWIEKLKNQLRTTDLIIAIITDNYFHSRWAQLELSTIIFGNHGVDILPIIVGNIVIPSFIMQIQCIKVDNTNEIASMFSNQSFLYSYKNQVFIKKIDFQSLEYSIEPQLNSLKTALSNNRLSLVCGAGISIDSNIPRWKELLIDTLNESLNKHDLSNTVSAEQLIKELPQSNLIIGKYLRQLLGRDFEKVIRDRLYREYNISNKARNVSEMMKSIVNLASYSKNNNRLDSIITFNFDELVEYYCSKNGINICPIWKESQRYNPNQLPIYHVHGFLPNSIKLDEPNLVFDETTYHTQSIDPFCWANLVQLNTYSSNTCLFVGVSLSDPNLRRLLDISMRKNSKQNHFIIKTRKDATDASSLATMLFECDAASLGLSVIWCSRHEEIPKIINKICEN